MGLVGTVNTAKSIGNQLSSLFGYNTWDLSDAKFNGCTFATFATIPILENNPIYKTGENAVALIDQFTGGDVFGRTDPNATGRLYDTYMGLVGMTEQYIPQIVVKQIPYANKANTENLGGGGYEFTFNIIIIGQDYQKAVYNLENAIKNPDTQYLNTPTLIHPTRGKIKGLVRCTGFLVNSNVQIWNGCTVALTFRAEECNISELKKPKLIQQIINSINTVLDLITSISATIATIKALFNNHFYSGAKKPSPKTYTNAQNLADSLTNLNNSLLQNTNYIYKKSNLDISNPALDSTKLNNDFIPKSLAYGIEFNATQGNIIMEYYNNICNNNIAKLKETDFGGLNNDAINQIYSSLAELYNLANLCAQINFSYTFTVPYVMSLYKVMALNNIALTTDNAWGILKANPQIASANYIPQGEVVFL